MEHFPKPYCENQAAIKAFVLGCDPTAFDKNGKRLSFDYVFDLDNDLRYFAGVLRNLEFLDIFLKDIFVQNLVIKYQEQETSKNKGWKVLALNVIPERKKEFDAIDNSKQVPVFLTSEVLYKVLLLPNEVEYKAFELYNLKAPVPISPDQNLLQRPLFPLYRYFRYKLDKHSTYANYVKTLLR